MIPLEEVASPGLLHAGLIPLIDPWTGQGKDREQRVCHGCMPWAVILNGKQMLARFKKATFCPYNS